MGQSMLRYFNNLVHLTAKETSDMINNHINYCFLGCAHTAFFSLIETNLEAAVMFTSGVNKTV